MSTTRSQTAKPEDVLAQQVDRLLDGAEEACRDLQEQAAEVAPLEAQVEALLHANGRAAAPPSPASAPPPLVDISALDEQLAALSGDMFDGEIEGPAGTVVESIAARDGEPNAQETSVASDAGTEPAGAVPADVVVEQVVAAVEPATGIAIKAHAAPAVEALATSKTAPARPAAASAAITIVHEAAPLPGSAKRARGPVMGAMVSRGLHRAAALVSAPLNSQPKVVRDSIGWIALWTGFLAVSVAMAVLVFRKAATVEAPEEGAGIKVHEGREAQMDAPKAVPESNIHEQPPAHEPKPGNPGGWQVHTSGGSH